MKKRIRAIGALLLALSCLFSAVSVSAATLIATFKIENATAETLFVEDGTVTLPKPSKAVNGTFVGWHTEKDGADLLYPAGATVTLDADAVFDAVVISYDTCEGASVRLVEDNVALRFTSKIAKSDYELLTSYVGTSGIAFGTYIIAEDYLYKTLFTFTLEALQKAGYNKYLDIPATGWYEVDKDSCTIAGSVSHIRDENYSRSYAGIGYMKVTYSNGTVGTVYSSFHHEDNARNIYKVVFAAYEDRAANHMFVIPANVHGSEFVTHSPYTLTQLDAMKKFLDSVAAVNITIASGKYVYTATTGTYYKSPWRVSYTSDEYDRYVVTVTAPVGSSVYDVKALFFGGARLAIANNAKVSVSASAIVIQHSAYSDPI